MFLGYKTEVVLYNTLKAIAPSLSFQLTFSLSFGDDLQPSAVFAVERLDQGVVDAHRGHFMVHVLCSLCQKTHFLMSAMLRKSFSIVVTSKLPVKEISDDHKSFIKRHGKSLIRMKQSLQGTHIAPWSRNYDPVVFTASTI